MSVLWDWDEEPKNDSQRLSKSFPEVGYKGGCAASPDPMTNLAGQINNLRQYTRHQPEPKGWVDEIEYECTRG